MRGATARRGTVATATSLLDRERTIAMLGFNRWLVPPAALAIHLCIGMAYGFSVFWLPLSRALGVTQPVTCPSISFATELFTTTCDWRISSLGWMYTLFFVMLGSSAAIWGGWLERVGPRKAAVVSALCWCMRCTIESDQKSARSNSKISSMSRQHDTRVRRTFLSSEIVVSRRTGRNLGSKTSISIHAVSFATALLHLEHRRGEIAVRVSFDAS